MAKHTLQTTVEISNISEQNLLKRRISSKYSRETFLDRDQRQCFILDLIFSHPVFFHHPDVQLLTVSLNLVQSIFVVQY